MSAVEVNKTLLNKPLIKSQGVKTLQMSPILTETVVITTLPIKVVAAYTMMTTLLLHSLAAPVGEESTRME